MTGKKTMVWKSKALMGLYLGIIKKEMKYHGDTPRSIANINYAEKCLFDMLECSCGEKPYDFAEPADTRYRGRI